jgi:hypothetical protein
LENRGLHRDFFAVLRADSPTSTTYHRKFSGAKMKCKIDEGFMIENLAAGSKYAEERRFFLHDVSTLANGIERFLIEAT